MRPSITLQQRCSSIFGNELLNRIFQDPKILRHNAISYLIDYSDVSTGKDVLSKATGSTLTIAYCQNDANVRNILCC